MLACAGGNDGGSDAPAAGGTTSDLKTSIEGSCRLAETGSEITLIYRVELIGNGQITRVRLLVDGARTEETGRTNERSVTRTANIKVPDQTTHTFQVVAEAGSIKSNASTTIPCVAPTKGPPL